MTINPLPHWLHRRWSVAYVTRGALVQARRHRYWTYKGALRVAASWNKHQHGPGTFEVFGPAGKGED